VVHSFTEAPRGGYGGGLGGPIPFQAGVRLDSVGNLYGTVEYGGASGEGAVYKLAPDGTYTYLHSFNGDDGSGPSGGVVLDSVGNLFGTTGYGGLTRAGGVVFRLAPNGTFAVLHEFSSASEGAAPRGGLVLDGQGNVYGTTTTGAGSESNDAFAFKLAPNGAYTVLHNFATEAAAAGTYPTVSDFVLDHAGNLYGTTLYTQASGAVGGEGVVFKLTAKGG